MDLLRERRVMLETGKKKVRRRSSGEFVVIAGVVFAIVVICVALTSTAQAAYIGTRSTDTPGALVVSDDEWSVPKGGFKIDFSVEWTGSLWSYTYTFSDADGTPLDPTISRFLKIEVSEGITGATYAYISDCGGEIVPLTPMAVSFHLWDAPASDPSYDMYCLMIGDNDDQQYDELSDCVITILSSQGPMWGNFYARDGDPYAGYDGPAEALNRGFNEGLFPDPITGEMLSSVGVPPAFDPYQNMNGMDVNYWILVPDTYIPEPATLLLFAAGALLLRKRS